VARIGESIASCTSDKSFSSYVGFTNNLSIEESEDTKYYIKQFVSIDERNRIDKEELFKELYLLWENNNFVKITVIKDNFNTSKDFIKK